MSSEGTKFFKLSFCQSSPETTLHSCAAIYHLVKKNHYTRGCWLEREVNPQNNGLPTSFREQLVSFLYPAAILFFSNYKKQSNIAINDLLSLKKLFYRNDLRFNTSLVICASPSPNFVPIS